MVKLNEKKSQNYFYSMVRCWRNVNFEKIDTESSTGKNDQF